MPQIKCVTCRTDYDTDDYDNCPDCGYDNQPTVEELDQEGKLE